MCQPKCYYSTFSKLIYFSKEPWHDISQIMSEDVWCLFRHCKTSQGSFFPSYPSSCEGSCHCMLNKSLFTLPMLIYLLYVLATKPLLGGMRILGLQDGHFNPRTNIPKNEHGVFQWGSRLPWGCYSFSHSVEETIEATPRDMSTSGSHFEGGHVRHFLWATMRIFPFPYTI